MPEVREKKSDPRYLNLREKLFIAEQASEFGIKVVPGKRWGLYYSQDESDRKRLLQGVLEGKFHIGEIASVLKPDALIYDASDLVEKGLDEVTGRIRDISANINHFNYLEFIGSKRHLHTSLDFTPESILNPGDLKLPNDSSPSNNSITATL